MHKVNEATSCKSSGFEVNFMPSSQGRSLRKKKAHLFWDQLMWIETKCSPQNGKSWQLLKVEREVQTKTGLKQGSDGL